MIAALLVIALQSASYDACAAGIDRGGFVKSQMLDCATRDMDRADGALNATYRAVVARLSPTRQTQLRRDERAWIDRRRATCRRASQQAIPSPEINRLLCLVRETDARTAYLKTVD